MNHRVVSGVGMTSQRTRTRMIDRLREQGIRDEKVLAAIAAVPRHVFRRRSAGRRAPTRTPRCRSVSRNISQPFIVARMIEVLREGRELGKRSRSVPDVAIRPRCWRN
jgi:Protein-L-isoaspartate carboxylmethyltransferase